MKKNIYNSKTSLNIDNLLPLAKNNETSIWVYDEKTILDKLKKLAMFDIIRFSQKSCSNISILKILKYNNVKIDAVSLGEIERSLIAGFSPNNNNIVFTSDLLDIKTINRIVDLNIPVNIGSIDMINQLGKFSPKHKIWLRINPKFGDGYNIRTNTGGENSKHGIWNIFEAIEKMKKFDFDLIGLHMHIGSGAKYINLVKVCDEMLNNVINIKKDIQYISCGGGLPIPYFPKEKNVNINNYFKLWNNTRKKIEKYLGHKIYLEIEPGRFIVAESGVLISQIRTIKKVNNRYFILVNAGFNDLIRPSIYGSYHHISLMPIDNRKLTNEKISYVIGGPLCESGDIFTQDSSGKIQTRLLPKAKIGDYLVFHDTGAYGSSMSSNYNSKPLIPEFLITKKNEIKKIRRAQTIKEMISLELL
ncbi:diaminopimelate decarboxylase [Buchnera aphidicola (Taiwanaphis decaspermi)]|uniref:diaminopimelate decarboxylase n=1 Tax=Buchnera aphidicola TaxID=9 RepID=UPI0031B85533